MLYFSRCTIYIVPISMYVTIYRRLETFSKAGNTWVTHSLSHQKTRMLIGCTSQLTVSEFIFGDIWPISVSDFRVRRVGSDLCISYITIWLEHRTYGWSELPVSRYMYRAILDAILIFCIGIAHFYLGVSVSRYIFYSQYRYRYTFFIPSIGIAILFSFLVSVSRYIFQS